ncbi:MAG: NTP transferase domain-containing protein [Mucilaginibacter sp.]|uniref:nucleotidyltransferase family protein n=1 Tax=Mucilaginibacter sp. TaxID=1882438 RepID=UPI0034E51681
MNPSETPKPDLNIAVVILAGGSSSRLGKPKQLLHYQNETLIKHAVKTALSVSPKAVVVVSGFLHEELVGEVESNELVQLIHNPNWQQGMGSSIRAGINALGQHPGFSKIDAALILLCDQPLINAQHLQRLLAQFSADKRSMIVATGYAETQGVPAIFDRSLFPVLQNLPPEKGARWLFKAHQNNVAVVPFEGAAIDVDTEEDYQRLLALNKPQR